MRSSFLLWYLAMEMSNHACLYDHGEDMKKKKQLKNDMLALAG